MLSKNSFADDIFDQKKKTIEKIPIANSEVTIINYMKINAILACHKQ